MCHLLQAWPLHCEYIVLEGHYRCVLRSGVHKSFALALYPFGENMEAGLLHVLNVLGDWILMDPVALTQPWGGILPMVAFATKFLPRPIESPFFVCSSVCRSQG